MLKSIRRKRAAVAATGVAVLAAAGGAFAYFATTGTGTGNATVGAVGAWNPVSVPAFNGPALYPGGGQVQTSSVTATNTSAGYQQLHTLHVTGITSSNAPACVPTVETGAANTGTSDFWIPDVTGITDSVAGGQVSPAHTMSLTMNDTGSDQTACAGSTLTVTVRAS
jgi:hypothetical protein